MPRSFQRDEVDLDGEIGEWFEESLKVCARYRHAPVEAYYLDVRVQVSRIGPEWDEVNVHNPIGFDRDGVKEMSSR